MGLGALAKIKASPVNTVLGVDASTNSIAFCLFDKSGPVRWGEINFTGQTVFERLADGQRKIVGIKKHLKSDLILIESAVYIQNKKTVILLAYAFGALVAALMTKKSRVEEIKPMEWQRLINNKPLTKAEKEQIQKDNPGKSKSWYSNAGREIRKQRTAQWVKDNYGIDTASDNVSDAIAIAAVGYQKFVLDNDPLKMVD